MTEKSVTFKLMNIFSGTFMRNFAYKGMAIVYLYMAHFIRSTISKYTVKRF